MAYFTYLWIRTAVLSVDGEVVYGWEMREGSYNAWNEYVHSPEELENVIGDNMLHVLTSQDGRCCSVLHR